MSAPSKWRARRQMCEMDGCEGCRNCGRGETSVRVDPEPPDMSFVGDLLTTERMKMRARHALHYRVRKGEIVPPATCERCQADHAQVAHHTDYARPLEVFWLCNSCHRLVHPGGRI